MSRHNVQSHNLAVCFQTHLNWTWVLGWLLFNVAAFVIEDMGLGAIVLVVGLVTMVPLSLWVITQKGRSMWWVFLSGIFSPVWLKNENEEA